MIENEIEELNFIIINIIIFVIFSPSLNKYYNLYNLYFIDIIQCYVLV